MIFKKLMAKTSFRKKRYNISSTREKLSCRRRLRFFIKVPWDISSSWRKQCNGNGRPERAKWPNLVALGKRKPVTKVLKRRLISLGDGIRSCLRCRWVPFEKSGGTASVIFLVLQASINYINGEKWNKWRLHWSDGEDRWMLTCYSRNSFARSWRLRFMHRRN